VIRPEALVLLGATAAQALLGPQIRIGRDRGTRIDSDLAQLVMVTTHPYRVRQPRRRRRVDCTWAGRSRGRGAGGRGSRRMGVDSRGRRRRAGRGRAGCAGDRQTARADRRMGDNAMTTVFAFFDEIDADEYEYGYDLPYSRRMLPRLVAKRCRVSTIAPITR
jgi:hypothetical protein